jgi:tRNA dimethylallyltransferase
MRSSAGLDDDSLLVITGPTAAGKSALAMALAETHGGAIISADSRQVYRGFDVGTAKPTAEERERVPHFGIDVAEPTERYSAARWAARATEWIASARASGRIPLIVGGTGFYVRALVDPLADAPELDPGRRRTLENALRALSVDELRRWCERLDPPRAHLGRAQLARAVEVALLTGTRLSDWHAREAGAPRREARYLVVDPGRALGARIESRLTRMLGAGWEAEVRALEAVVPDDAPAWNASGYRHVRALVRGRMSRDRAVERTLVDTRQYAKRQRTWIRHQLPPERTTWLDPMASDAERRAAAWLEGGEERAG